jgi:hypothetical protein
MSKSKLTKEAIKLLEPLYENRLILPERYLSKIDEDAAKMAVLRWLSSIGSRDNIHSLNTASKIIPDYAKFAHKQVLDVPSVFAKKPRVRDVDLYEAKYSALPMNEINYFAPINVSNFEAQKALSQLLRELAYLRNPKGTIAFRDFQFANRDPKVQGVVSMSKNPIDLDMSNSNALYTPYAVKPKNILSDFSDSPFGFKEELEIQTILPGARRIGKSLEPDFIGNQEAFQDYVNKQALRYL